MRNSGARDGRRCRAKQGCRRTAIAAIVAVAWPSTFIMTAGVVPGVARAADTVTERAARQHFRQGEVHYAAGRYVDALSAYQAGYAVEPLPGFLVNIAQCQRRLGELERARATYGKFVLVAPDSPLAPEVRGLIEELDRLILETAAADRTPLAAGGEGEVQGTRPARVPGAGSSEIMPLGGQESGGGPPARDGTDLTLKPGTTTSAPGRTVGDGRGSGSGHPRWWLWGGLATVVVGAAVLGLVLSAPSGS